MRIGHGPSRPFVIAALSLLLSAALLAGCSDDSSDPTRPPDTTPPAVTALQIDRVEPTGLRLSWSAPGDDGGSGRAALYELRHAAFPLTEENWTQGTAVTGLDAPGFARSRETVILEDLSPGVTYYVHLRARDEASNWSEISAPLAVTLPIADGAPSLWGGRLLAAAGTTETAFIFQVREKLAVGASRDPEVLPAVVLNGVAYAMRHVVRSGSGDPFYEFDLRLPAGSYEYYFTMTNKAGQSCRLPSPGTWAGPSVSEHRTWALDFVRVEPGIFTMGNSAAPDTLERPGREVELTRAFLCDRHEVTNAQMCAALNWALGQGLVRVDRDTAAVLIATEELLARVAPRRTETDHGIQYAEATGFAPAPFREDLPATYVSWFGAAYFCNVRNWQAGLAPSYVVGTWESIPRRNPYGAEGWRLPTEAEWEYLAQYNDGRTFPSGDGIPRPGIDGNFGGIAGGVTRVGLYPDGSGALGIRDLMGNVWEWCHDWEAPYRASDRLDPVQWSVRTSRIARGGSWGSSISELRCTKRFGQPPARAFDGLGFRCVRTAP